MMKLLKLIFKYLIKFPKNKLRYSFPLHQVKLKNITSQKHHKSQHFHQDEGAEKICCLQKPTAILISKKKNVFKVIFDIHSLLEKNNFVIFTL